MSKKQNLELTRIGKDARPKLEPRILLSDPEKSYYAKHRVTENDFIYVTTQTLNAGQLQVLSDEATEFSLSPGCSLASGRGKQDAEGEERKSRGVNNPRQPSLFGDEGKK